jgi:hypothetical protein
MAGLGARRPLPLASPVGVAVARTLDAADHDQRLRQWRRVLVGAARTPLEDGPRLHLPAQADTAELARLVATERRCCAFFDLHLSERTALEVRAPAQAQNLIAEVFAEHP